MDSLKTELARLRQEIDSALPAEAREKLQRATQRLVANKVADNAARVGDAFPQFSLPDAGGNAINSSDFLSRGPLVVCFYRGGWCPYCNLQLRAFQSRLGEIRATGADFVAISPQLPDESLSMAAKANLTFEVLSDTGNSLAEHLGLMFEVPESVRGIYRSRGVDLELINGIMKWTLPLTATFVVDRNSIIVDAFVQADYTIRRDPVEVIALLKDR